MLSGFKLNLDRTELMNLINKSINSVEKLVIPVFIVFTSFN